MPSFLKVVLINVFLFISLATYTQNAELQWAKSFTGDSFNRAYSIAIDKFGNVYTTGIIDGVVDFDPNDGVYELYASFFDIYISKLDASGNFVWAKVIGSYRWDQGNSIAVDDSGNVYTTGAFHSNVDFDPGPEVYYLWGDLNYSNTYVNKLDSSGNFVWAINLGSGHGVSIAVGNSGNVYTAAHYIRKIDVSGNLAWSGKFSGLCSIASMAIDNSENVYTTGYYNDTVDFDPGPEVYYLSGDPQFRNLFVSKLDSSGNFVWAKNFGTGSGVSIAVEDAGFVYCSTSEIRKLDASGNLAWSRKFSGEYWVQSIALDNSGNVYTTGYFSGNTDFDPGTEVYDLTSEGYDYDIFISKLDSSGGFIWAKRLGGTSTEMGFSIKVDAFLNVYTSGYFGGTADFDPSDDGIFNLTTEGYEEIFVHKMSQSYVGIDKVIASNDIEIYPNPASTTISIRSEDVLGSIKIMDINGRTVFTTLSKESTAEINVSEYQNGVYILKVSNEKTGEFLTKRFIINR